MQSKVNKDSFQQIIENLPAMVAIYNINTGEYYFVSEGIRKLLGFSPTDFTSKGIKFVTGLVHPEDIGRIMSENTVALKKANSKKSKNSLDPIVSFEYRMKHKNGSWRWLHTDGSVYSRDAKGKVDVVMNISIDITDLKDAEENLKMLTLSLEERIKERTLKLQESEERYQNYISQSSDAIWRFELKKPVSIKDTVKKQINHFFRYAYLAECNDVLAKMYGLSKASDIIG